MSYIEEAYSPKQKADFMTKYRDSIPIDAFIMALKGHLNRDLRVEEPRPFFIRSLSYYLKDIMKSGDKRHVEAAMDLLGKYARYLPHDRLDKGTKEKLFINLHYLINAIDATPQFSVRLGINLENHFIHYNNYQFENDFRHLLKHLISKLNFWLHHYTPIGKLILEKGIRMRLVTSKHLEGISKIVFLPYAEKEYYKLLQDSSYKTTPNNLSSGTIPIVLANPNMGDYIAEHQEDIIKTIGKMNHINLVFTLATFDQPNSRHSQAVLDAVIKQVTEKTNNFEFCDLTQLVNNLHSLKFPGVSRSLASLAGHIIDSLALKPRAVTPYTHCEVIRLLGSFPGVNSKKYFEAVAKHYQDQRDKESYHLVLSRLAMTTYYLSPTDIEAVPAVVASVSAPTALRFFLSVEDRLEAEPKSKAASSLVENLNGWVNSKSNEKLPSAELKYFQDKYPEEASQLSIPEDKHVTFKFLSELKSKFLFVSLSGLRTASLS